MDFLKKGVEAAKKAGSKAVSQLKEVRILFWQMSTAK